MDFKLEANPHGRRFLGLSEHEKEEKLPGCTCTESPKRRCSPTRNPSAATKALAQLSSLSLFQCDKDPVNNLATTAPFSCCAFNDRGGLQSSPEPPAEPLAWQPRTNAHVA